MDSSSSRNTLPIFFDEIIEWKRSSQNHYSNWTANHLSVVRGYVSKLVGLNSESTAAMVASSELFRNTKDPQIVAYFTQELQQFFIVPRIQQPFDKNELVAAFINFLLHLLCHKTDFVIAFQDRIGRLEKELRFLVTALGDAIWLFDDEQLRNNLLTELEAVADEAGILVHSFFFSVDPVFQSMYDGLDVFLKNIHLLKFSITIFLVLPPASITPKTTSTTTVDSIFIADSLLCDLEHLLNHDDSLIVDVKGQIKTLHHELMSLLKDMKVDGGPEMVEAELQIKDVAYEAEFLIGSFLVGDAPLWYFSIRLPRVIHKIKLIGTRLQEITNDIIGVSKVYAQLSLDAKTNSVVMFDEIVVGFEDNAIDILEQLVGGTERLQIVSIFGMPGLGKTTFAKKLYAHPFVYYRFDKCLWSVVSQAYQKRRLLIDLLLGSSSELDRDAIFKMDEEVLVEHVYKFLKGRRYLIVMDDIWDSNAWYDVRRCFPDDRNGSRILLTTRNKDVAPPSSIIHRLPFLSDDQCWELLEKKVFLGKPCPAHLQGIGKDISANCFGLPLMVLVISGILSTMDKEENVWKQVGENVASYISSGGENSFIMMQILELSYKHLPKHLKSCFLYLGVFPEDKQIRAQNLMRLWISEGLIYAENRKPEDVAEEYLLELIDRSLVIVSQRRSDGGVGACVIHDLLRELCLRKDEEEGFLRLVVKEDCSIYEKSHRISSLGSLIAPFGHHLRSFNGNFLGSPLYVANMKLLRVLGSNKPIDPACDIIGIEFLIQLRYLILCDLPASLIGGLANLEYITVERMGTIAIPSVILKLMKLRYIHVIYRARYGEDCDSSQTNNLQSLSHILLYNRRDEEILKCSRNLRKLTCTCKPLYAREKKAYQYTDFRFLTRLESLNITSFYERGPSPAEISFPATIRKLTVSRLGLPWETASSAIGRLPNLVILKLRLDAFAGEIWETRDGVFEQLRFLEMHRMGVEEWNVERRHFPKLERLVLSDCYNLKEVCSEIGEIVTLQCIELRGWCLKSLADSVVGIVEEQREMGNEELRVVFS